MNLFYKPYGIAPHFAVICPETGKPVVYLTCIECENKKDCNKGR